MYNSSNATGGFTFDKTTNTVTVGTEITLDGDNGHANISGDLNIYGNVNDADGSGIQLYSTDFAQLNYNDTAWVYVQNDGVYLESSGGNLKLDNNGNVTIDTGALKVNSNASILSSGDANVKSLIATGTGTAGTANVGSAIIRDISEFQIPYADGSHRLVGSAGLKYTTGTGLLETGNVTLTGTVDCAANVVSASAGGGTTATTGVAVIA